MIMEIVPSVEIAQTGSRSEGTFFISAQDKLESSNLRKSLFNVVIYNEDKIVPSTTQCIFQKKYTEGPITRLLRHEAKGPDSEQVPLRRWAYHSQATSHRALKSLPRRIVP